MQSLAYDFGTPRVSAPARVRSRVFAQLLSAAECAVLTDEWRDLETRAIEPNAFFSPAFMLTAAQHLTESGIAHFIVIRDGEGTRRLLGLFPVRAGGAEHSGPLLRGWTSPYAAFGAPLVDRDRVDEVVRAFLDFTNDYLPGTHGFLFHELDANGPLIQAISRAAAVFGLPVAHLSPRARAIFEVDAGGDVAALGVDRKDRKELRRCRRRLQDHGDVQFDLASDYDAVRHALERFLALEAAGWKGKRGSALLQTPGRANFTRTMIWSLARQGRVRVASLNVNGELAAGMLILMSGERGFLWKIAYDEAYATCAPGVLLVEDVSRAFLATGRPPMIDSCALPGSQMIETLWRGRIALCDLMVGLDSRKQPAFRSAVAREELRRSLRARMKAVYRRLRGWKAA